MSERTGSMSRRTALRSGAGIAVASTAAAGTASAEQHEAWAESISEYLADTPNFDGEIEDHRGEDEVQIMVGAGDSGVQFEPAAVQISPGTTIQWEWMGGAHNVYHDDELDDVDEQAFESEVITEEGATFGHTFEDPGRFRYVCTPHRNQHMKGGILVSDEELDLSGGDGGGGGSSIDPVWAALTGAFLLIPMAFAVYLMIGELTGSEE